MLSVTCCCTYELPHLGTYYTVLIYKSTILITDDRKCAYRKLSTLVPRSVRKKEVKFAPRGRDLMSVLERVRIITENKRKLSVLEGCPYGEIRLRTLASFRLHKEYNFQQCNFFGSSCKPLSFIAIFLKIGDFRGRRARNISQENFFSLGFLARFIQRPQFFCPFSQVVSSFRSN